MPVFENGMTFVMCDVCLFIFSGLLPTVSRGTHVIIPLVEDLEDDRWEAAIVEQKDKRIKLSVNSPPTAVIGRYQLIVETTCPNGQATSTHDPANDIHMLFNPWCEGKYGIKYREKLWILQLHNLTTQDTCKVYISGWFSPIQNIGFLQMEVIQLFKAMQCC